MEDKSNASAAETSAATIHHCSSSNLDDTNVTNIISRKVEENAETKSSTKPQEHQVTNSVNKLFQFQPTEKRNLGRSARKRKAKLRSIHQEIEQLLDSSTSKLNDSATINAHQHSEGEKNIKQKHADRSQTLPGVLSRRNEDEKGSTSFSSDHFDLVCQLGFIPGNAISVVTRRSDIQPLIPPFIYSKMNVNDKNNAPVVLKLYPLAIREIQSFSNGNKRRGRKFQAAKNKPVEQNDEIEPFPTMYWLTCPILKNIISLLEHKQYIKQFEEKLQSSQDFISDMQLAHNNYGRTRWEMLTDDDQSYVVNRGWKACLGEDRGVAGLRNVHTIKCLHTHAAHYLSGETRNIVGKWVMEAVKELNVNDFNINTK